MDHADDRSRSSAPCRIHAAARLSTTRARRARLEFASSMRTRFTAAVESRSSQKAMGRSWRLNRRLAKARADWQRGPSVPSILIGNPMIIPSAARLCIRLRRVSRSFVNFTLEITLKGLATMRDKSETATPIVFSPRSKPTTGLPGWSAYFRSRRSRTGMASVSAPARVLSKGGGTHNRGDLISS